MRQIFKGVCEECQQPFEKWKRGNQPYRFCSASCSTRAKNLTRARLPEVEAKARRAAARKRWRQNHPDVVKAQKMRNYEKHKMEIRARRAPTDLANARALRQDVLAAFGGKCVRCGFDDPRALHMDHVNGGGNIERKLLKSSSMRYKKMLAEPDQYQLLCANCNFIKKAEESEHRWKKVEA
jgi:hypothetical protein